MVKETKETVGFVVIIFVIGGTSPSQSLETPINVCYKYYALKSILTFKKNRPHFFEPKHQPHFET